MKGKDIIKRHLLFEKAKKHFAQNPNARSLVVTMGREPEQTIWRVTNNRGSFGVVELHTIREQFTISEKDDSKPEKKEKDDKKPDDKKEPKEPKMTSKKSDSDIETNADALDTDKDSQDPREPMMQEPEEPSGEPSEVPPEEQPATKTGEEMRLKNIVGGRPLQDISVDTDQQGGHVVLHMVGLNNPVEIHIFQNGKAVWKYGNLSNLLKTSAVKTK